jgi:hypothetical protein
MEMREEVITRVLHMQVVVVVAPGLQVHRQHRLVEVRAV